MGKKAPRSPGWDGLQTLAARGLFRVFAGLPLPLAGALGRSIAAVFHRCDQRHGRRVAEQMRLALGPELPAARIQELTRRMYAHFGLMLAEFSRLPALTPERIDQIVNWGDDLAALQELTRRTGVIFATGHIGNWEFTGFASQIKGLSVGAVARPLDNPRLDEFVRGIRQCRGQEIWDKFGAMRQTLRVLKAGQSFGILVDQDAGQRGLFVPFFGLPASTIPTPADLALHTGAPIVCAVYQRTADGRPLHFDFRHRPPIYPDPSAPREAERLRLLTLVNKQLADLIRQAPEQWLWLHRRWKTRPPGETAGPNIA